MIPATPNSGTADTNPLVTVAQYQAVTQDSATSSETVTANLADALDMIQRECRRTLLYAQYTERLYLYRNGQVYPTATPLDTSKAVISPAGTSNIGIFQGNGIWVGWFIPLPSLPVWVGVVPPQTDITYWGGYTGPAGAGPQLPASLRRIVCKVCWYLSNPAVLTDMPGGVKSVSVGGVSMSGDLASMVSRDRQLGRDIKRWRHPQAHAWDAQVTTTT
ncbi:MAG TPA: hypothetical protein VHT75_04325 [Acidimicrobiales bacterium]|jgi:hypothetical protein|nr:hypothetical protein [Acidimicrobiales bacterium]